MVSSLPTYCSDSVLKTSLLAFLLEFPSVLHLRTPNSNPRYQGRMRTVCVQWRFRERIHSRLSGLHSHHERRIPPPFGCYPRRESQRTLHARREDFSGNRKDLGRCGSQIHHGTKGQKEEELLINRIDLPFFVIVPVLQGWIQLILLVVWSDHWEKWDAQERLREERAGLGCPLWREWRWQNRCKIILIVEGMRAKDWYIYLKLSVSFWSCLI